jgi:hypothetical protein
MLKSEKRTRSFENGVRLDKWVFEKSKLVDNKKMHRVNR